VESKIVQTWAGFRNSGDDKHRVRRRQIDAHLPSPFRPTAVPLPLHRRAILFAAAAAAIAGGRNACAAQPMRIDWPRRRPVPPLRLSTLDGAAWSLADEHDHTLLLNFWASWCEPCRAEMPSLAALAERERKHGLRVIAANYRESVDTVRGFLASSPIALDVALDSNGAAAKALDVHAFPSTVAIARDGRIRFVVMGECDWSDARSRSWLDELLGKRD